MIGTISYDDLAVFATVARELSFVAAARRLGTPTSTVSRRVAALEASMGARLLQRTSRRVALTDEGARIAERLEPLLAELDAAVENAAEATPSGRLRVTAPVATGAEIVAPALFAFAEAHPKVTVELLLTNAVVDLVAERVDLAFRAGPVRAQGAIARKLGTVPFAIAASPSFVARHLAGSPKVRPESLAALPAVVTQMATFRLVARSGAARSIKPVSRFVVADPRVAVAAAASGVGLVSAPRPLIEAEGARLVEIEVRGHEVAGRELFLVYPSRRHLAPRVRAAIAWMVASVSSRLKSGAGRPFALS